MLPDGFWILDFLDVPAFDGILKTIHLKGNLIVHSIQCIPRKPFSTHQHNALRLKSSRWKLFDILRWIQNDVQVLLRFNGLQKILHRLISRYQGLPHLSFVRSFFHHLFVDLQTIFVELFNVIWICGLHYRRSHHSFQVGGHKRYIKPEKIDKIQRNFQNFPSNYSRIFHVSVPPPIRHFISLKFLDFDLIFVQFHSTSTTHMNFPMMFLTHGFVKLTNVKFMHFHFFNLE